MRMRTKDRVDSRLLSVATSCLLVVLLAGCDEQTEAAPPPPPPEVVIAEVTQDAVPIVLAPIAFVSEHSETLVELDIEYRAVAEENGVPAYLRVETAGIGERFVAGLARLVRQSLADDRPLCSQDGARICPARWGRCPQTAVEEELASA